MLKKTFNSGKSLKGRWARRLVVDRLPRTQEVRGSIPLASTNSLKYELLALTEELRVHKTNGATVDFGYTYRDNVSIN